MVALTKFFLSDAETNAYPFQYHGILILFRYGDILIIIS